MKISDIIDTGKDFLQEAVELLEYGFSRDEIKKRINDLREQIIKHLIKILAMPQNDAKNHWKKELLGFCGRIAIMKTTSTNKPPGRKLVKEFLFHRPFGPEDEFDNTAFEWFYDEATDNYGTNKASFTDIKLDFIRSMVELSCLIGDGNVKGLRQFINDL